MAEPSATASDLPAGRTASARRPGPPIIAAFAAVAFVTLTVLVVTDVTQGIDDRAAVAASEPMRERLILPSKAALHLLDPRVSIVVTVAVGAAAFVVTSRARHLGRAVSLVVLWAAITVTLKAVLDRPLPYPGGEAYPSGHMGGAVVVCGVAGLAVAELVPTGWWRRIAGLVLAAVPISLAALLIMTGGHWLTDVVGGALLATACLGAVELVIKRRDRRDRLGAPGADVAAGDEDRPRARPTSVSPDR